MKQSNKSPPPPNPNKSPGLQISYPDKICTKFHCLKLHIIFPICIYFQSVFIFIIYNLPLKDPRFSGKCMRWKYLQSNCLPSRQAASIKENEREIALSENVLKLPYIITYKYVFSSGK